MECPLKECRHNLVTQCKIDPRFRYSCHEKEDYNVKDHTGRMTDVIYIQPLICIDFKYKEDDV